jgi:hypothetical protein
MNIPTTFVEEALDALLTRIRWYYARGHTTASPRATGRAFNYFCDLLDKDHDPPWTRVTHDQMK